MTRRVRTLAAALLVGGLTVPAGTAAAGCTSELPVSDKRLASHACTGAHPGMGLVVPSKKWGNMTCTAGFAFADQFGNRYLTIPGTCFLDYDCLEDAVVEQLPPPLNQLVRPPVCLMPADSEEEPFFKRTGPVITDTTGNRVGMLIYAVNKDRVNFALVKVDKRVKLDPALPLYGGPVRSGAPATNVEEAYSYSAPGFPLAPNARTGVLYSLGSVYHWTEAFISSSSGSPVMKPDGTAVGYYGNGWTIGLGWNVHPYEPALRRTVGRTKLKLRMLTAKLSS